MKLMPRWLRDLPVARKLGLLLALNTTLAVLAIAVVFTVGGALTRYHDAQQQLQAMAEVIGENSRAALAFNDRPGALAVLDALRVKQDIGLAVLRDSRQQTFVRRAFERGDDRLHGILGTMTDRLLPLKLTVSHRIDDGSIGVGYIELTAGLNGMWADVLESMGLMALVGVALAVLAVYFGMRLRSLVISPVLELARVSHQVSLSQDYSLRAGRQGNDEVGRLVDDFNHMLSEIQTRDEALRQERASLEERVDQRTAELKRAMDEATQANRVKSEFLSTVSHELRTPLTAISGSIGLLAGEALGPLPEQVLNLLRIAQKNGQRLALLINDLLDVEKLMAGKLRFDVQRQPLMPLLEQALADNEAYAQTLMVKLVLTDRMDDALVDVDALRLQQVLSNLLSNAAKFSPRGGRVELGAHRVGETVRVTVTDHGVGIAPSFRQRVFERFSQADSTDTRKKGGTGLGLAISRELIERMGGRIGFESEEGQGACFYFDLQLSYASGGESTWSGLLSLPADAARVLLLEDDPDAARLIQRMLARAGYAVDLAEHAGDAALTLASRTNRFSAIVTELSAGDPAGVAFVRQLRALPSTRHLPVVAITGDTDRVRQALGDGAADVVLLAKPIEQSRLAATLDQLVAPQRQRSLRVLHVEDSGQDHRAVLDMADGQFDMELATTLREARTRVALERFDVVVLDLSLPNESGWDLLPEIRARQPDARVVVLTGGDISAEDARRVDAVLKKDQLSPGRLVQVISADPLTGSARKEDT